jgi:hypothetical protein
MLGYFDTIQEFTTSLYRVEATLYSRDYDHRLEKEADRGVRAAGDEI